jgi:hypothetical protein
MFVIILYIEKKNKEISMIKKKKPHKPAAMLAKLALIWASVSSPIHSTFSAAY